MIQETTVARFITRPGGNFKDINKFNPSTPDLIMGTLMKSGAHLLKSNCVYELVMNELTEVLELREVGEANIGQKWAHEYHYIPSVMGAMMWLTKEEFQEHVEKSESIKR